MPFIATGTPVAKQVPFDPTEENILTATNVQDAIDELSLGSTASDHHCGYYYIQTAQTVTIAQYKQSVTFGTLINDGILIVDGMHITEP